MPTRDEMEAEIRATSAAEGQQAPDDLLLGEMCTLVGYSSELSFSVEYRNGRALVMLDRNCGIAQSGGLTRFMPTKAVDVFRLTGQKKIRDGLDGVRRLFNDTVRDEMIGRTDSNWMACAMPPAS